MRMMGNILSWLVVLLLTGQAIWTMTHSNFTLGMVLVVGLAAAAWVLKLFYAPLWQFFTGSIPGKCLLGGLLAGCALLVFLVGFVICSGYSCQPKQPQQIMVVLGGGLRKDKPSLVLCYRLDKAFEYWQQHPEMLIAVTGGQGRDETRPEGAAMKDYLVAKGIPAERIISEEKSTSTEENFLFTKELLLEAGISPDVPIVVVTNAFHCYRGRQYARQAGFTNVTSLPAGMPASAVLPCYLREAFALLYYWVFKTSRSGWMHPFVGFMSLSKQYFYK